MRAPLLTGMGLGCGIVLGSWVIAQFIQPPVKPPQNQIKPHQQPLHTPRGSPSIDPKVLERAYAPPSEPLPPEARPTPSAISPPETEWRDLRRQKDAAAY